LDCGAAAPLSIDALVGGLANPAKKNLLTAALNLV
jgi:hypothetical protein